MYINAWSTETIPTFIVTVQRVYPALSKDIIFYPKYCLRFNIKIVRMKIMVGTTLLSKKGNIKSRILTLLIVIFIFLALFVFCKYLHCIKKLMRCLQIYMDCWRNRNSNIQGPGTVHTEIHFTTYEWIPDYPEYQYKVSRG